MGAGIHQFLRELEENLGYSEHTIAAYRRDLYQFEEVTGWSGSVLDLATLEPGQVQGYVRWLGRQGYRATTRNRKVAAVRSFAQYAAHEAGFAADAILERLVSAPLKAEPPDILSEEEVRILLKPSGAEPRDVRNHAILSVLLETGIKPAEVSALDVDDMDWERAILWTSQGGLELGNAFAPLQAYMQHSRPHLAKNPAAAALFLNQRGTRMTRQGIWRIVGGSARRAGVKRHVTPTLLRHTYARRLLRRGLSYREVKERMSLSSSHGLRIYHQQVDQGKAG